MLTSFFGKSSPVNYLLLGIFIIIAAVIAIFSSEIHDITELVVAKYSFVILGSVFSMLLLDFIIRKNELTMGNTYAVFLFSCFLVSFPMIFLEPKLICATILILFAQRRIFSLASEKNRSKKILDAALYITLASLFYFPSIGFLLFLFFVILKYSAFHIKMLLVVLVGVLLAAVLTATYSLLVNDSVDWVFSWFQPVSFDFSSYNNLNVLLPVTIITSITIWTGLHKLYKLPSLPKKERSKATLALMLMLISVAVTAASPSKTGAEALFMLPALAVLSANYIAYRKQEAHPSDAKTTFWFKELLLWSALLLSFLAFFIT